MSGNALAMDLNRHKLINWVLAFAYFIAGLIWILFALGFAFVLLQYLDQGAGVQFFPFGITQFTITIGLAHFCGFTFLSLFCSAIGFWFCARGVLMLMTGANSSE